MKCIQAMAPGQLTRILLISALGLIGAVAIACGGDSKAAPNSGERTIYLQATELDTSRTLEQNAFPQETRDAFPQYFGPADKPEENGGAGGYYLYMSKEDTWKIGSYMYLPQEITAYEGERLTLQILGVRGNEHHTILFGPDGEVVTGTDGADTDVVVKRGSLGIVTFAANEPGLYRLVCQTHGPNMGANIHVLAQ
jgi:plastocyanin